MKNEKKRIRKNMIELRQKMSESTRMIYSNSIAGKIEKMELFFAAKHILLYWSMKDEVYTHDFVQKWKNRKKIILPVIAQGGLKLRQYTGEWKKFKTAKFTILEPAGIDFFSPDLIDLAIVPGLAFDSKNNRLGYGKGYYDKLLAKMKTYKIGVCFDFQILDNIPHTKHDVKMDTVLTNQRLPRYPLSEHLTHNQGVTVSSPAAANCILPLGYSECGRSGCQCRVFSPMDQKLRDYWF
jgi:5-formyltetrahydrofolate cyclo-ligase